MRRVSELIERSKNLSQTVHKRVKILDFFKQHGLAATKDAFGVARATLFRWKNLLKDGGGKLEALDNLSRAPNKKRYSSIDARVIGFVEKTRKDWPRIGKDKIKPLLDEYCLQIRIRSVSASTIGRIINRNKFYFYVKGKKRKMHGKYKEKLRRGEYMPEKPGDLVQMDTVVLFDFGIRRYIITAQDIKSRFSFAYCYKSPTSKNAEDFMKKLDKVAPFEIKRVQTDNGSEFAKNFDEYIRESGRVHFFNYPRSPKMNAFVERFNGVVQQEFVEVKDVDPYNEIEKFNYDLMQYLLFYNTKRLHFALRMVPLLFICNNLNRKKSNMLWTRTDCWKNQDC